MGLTATACEGDGGQRLRQRTRRQSLLQAGPPVAPRSPRTPDWRTAGLAGRDGTRERGASDNMLSLLCYHAFMSKQLSIRGVPDHIADRLKRLSEARGQSVNTTVLELLHQAVDIDGRRARLDKYVDWSSEELRDFQRTLAAQRVIDSELWR